MNDRKFVGRAMSSSVLVRAGRRVAAGSALCAVVVAAARWQRRTEERIGVGLGGEWSREQERRTTEALVTLVAGSRAVAGSRVVAALSSLLAAPLAALPAAGSMRLLAPVLRRDLQARVRVAGYVLAIAVLTHTLLLGAFGIPVQAVGWGFRIGVASAGLFAIWRPEALAAAMRDRNGK